MSCSFKWLLSGKKKKKKKEKYSRTLLKNADNRHVHNLCYTVAYYAVWRGKSISIRVMNQDKQGEISWSEIRGNSFFNTLPLDITQSNSLCTMWILLIIHTSLLFSVRSELGWAEFGEDTRDEQIIKQRGGVEVRWGGGEDGNDSNFIFTLFISCASNSSFNLSPQPRYHLPW